MPHIEILKSLIRNNHLSLFSFTKVCTNVKRKNVEMHTIYYGATILSLDNPDLVLGAKLYPTSHF